MRHRPSHAPRSPAARAARISAAGVAAVLLALSTGTAAGQESPRPMTLVDLIEIPSIRDPQLSPDGRHVVYVRSEADWDENRSVPHLWRAEVDGGEERRITTGDEGQTSPLWSPGGRWIYLRANTGVRVELSRADPETGDRTRLTRGDHQVGSWSWAPALERHVFTLETPTDPGDVWILDGAGSETEPRRVTRTFEDLTDRFRLSRQEAITWRGAEGTRVEGILIYPLDYREGRRGARVERAPAPALRGQRGARLVRAMGPGSGVPVGGGAGKRPEGRGELT